MKTIISYITLSIIVFILTISMSITSLDKTSSLEAFCIVPDVNASIIEEIMQEERMCSLVSECGGGELNCDYVTVYDAEGNIVNSFWCKGWA